MTKEKKDKAIVIALTIILIIIILLTHVKNTHYTKQAIVTDVTSQVITLTDIKGHQWQYETDRTTRELKEHDVVTMIMYTNGTNSTIKDDRIIRIKRDTTIE